MAAPEIKSSAVRLSIVVVVYNMRREAPRTLYSLSPAYQQGVDPLQYEVIVVENGSTEALPPGLVETFGDNFRYTFLEDPPASPAYAANIGAQMARGKFLGLMIDGARLVTPGMVRLALTSLDAFNHPVVSSLAFHLGPDIQTETVKSGYDPEEEDRLLTSIDWRQDGYRLFEISALAGSSGYGWFQPIAESNCFFMPVGLFEELGGFDEGFVTPGGGLVNLDFYERACELPASQHVMLLGEATFQQVHGGIRTNSPTEEARRRWFVYQEEYRRLRGRDFTGPRQRPLLFGDVSVPALDWVRKSCDLFWASPHAPAPTTV